MQNLPPPQVYEQEMVFGTWGVMVNHVVDHVAEHAPVGARILDLMSGTGYLLGCIHDRRPDLVCTGVELDGVYIEYARQTYRGVTFEMADVRTWDSPYCYDIVLCTAGVHHLSDQEQEAFIARIAQYLSSIGTAIIADPYIADFVTDKERRCAAAELGYAYLTATIESGGSLEVIAAAVQVMLNDLLLVEWKTSVSRRMVMLRKCFGHIEQYKSWPIEPSGYGDYCFFLRR